MAIIEWSQSQSFWVSQLSSPVKIRNNFSDAWSAFVTCKKSSQDYRTEKNREFAKKVLSKIEDRTFSLFNKPKLCITNLGVEFIYQNFYEIIKYSDMDFDTKIKECLMKYRLDG